ncbi:MAG TPA: L-serine ammonia-lyase, iron-sulfur-dependent, subunit alpha [Rectinema sp.]|jgi:L-cysteine desulfidase|nr:MAG: Serine dehydratase alpha chain [Spirochaetes bacterium ADurb.Bin001]HNT59379.1 L-serine ammonia-lyase, iron-sulfur-dependent, subunit alpha [Rectinema sp.]HPN04039.1 L-serine ammonia-lyase, iron-sulfur-dependent, subunit alpha [Rectinema sp.]
MKEQQPGYYEIYLEILKQELVPALGCTEPVAVAYAAAMARDILGVFPAHAQISCSANIVKNVKGAVVPNTGGMRGIATAAIAGIVRGNAEAKLRVLESITEDDCTKIERLLKKGFCTTLLAEGIEGLYIQAIVTNENESAEVVIKDSHTNIVRIKRNDEIIFECDSHNSNDSKVSSSVKYDLLNVHDILDFANNVDLAEVSEIIECQIQMNTAISEEGLVHEYGCAIGKAILAKEGNSVRSRARARAAAGSDARMGGCAMPVIINSGSGNQGLTVSLPVIEYAKEMSADHEKLIRALVLSNLIALEQKAFIGKLSAYCGAVSAAVGSAAAITYLYGGNYEQISMTITNAIATASGILCDGAKSSCSAKIATALEAALLGHEMSMERRTFLPGEGLVVDQVDKTIHNFGYIGSVGMRQTDIEIINLMLKD